MPVQVKVAGVFFGRPLNQIFEEPYRINDTPKKIFARLDKKRVLGRKFFTGVTKSGRATFLLNGERLNFPESADMPLREGDEISVLSAIAGG